MASVKSPVVDKVRKLLVERFPPPATVRLEDNGGIIGVITSTEFFGMETMDRQQLIYDLLSKKLTREERWEVQIIVAVTPDEGTGYLAGPE